MSRVRRLAAGDPLMRVTVRPRRLARVNSLERVRWPLTVSVLRLVPRRLRTHPRLRRFYWQPEQVAAVDRRARQLAEEHGW